MRKAVFLDRDGTIIRDKNFLSSPDGIEILPGVPDALRQLKKAGFLLILITNQSGVGRGYFTIEIVDEIHKRLQELLKKEGAILDEIYRCPHHPDDHCECRKPRTKLFRDAIKKWDVDPSASYSIGDKESDLEAGKALGCQTIFIGPQTVPADYHVPSLLDAAACILKEKARKLDSK